MEAELRNLKSQHINYVEVELWNLKSQNILCVEAELQVTEYSRCEIFPVPYSMVRKTREGRAAGPCVKAILVVLLFAGGGTYWDFIWIFSVIIKQKQDRWNQATYRVNTPSQWRVFNLVRGVLG